MDIWIKQKKKKRREEREKDKKRRKGDNPNIWGTMPMPLFYLAGPAVPSTCLIAHIQSNRKKRRKTIKTPIWALN